MNSPLFGISGRSGQGKTTLIEAMLPWFGARGLTVNVIKHSHHSIELEPPGKESARFRRVGAGEVLIASPFLRSSENCTMPTSRRCPRSPCASRTRTS